MEIAPFLKQLKFSKTGHNFNKRINGLVQVFNVQKSQWNDKTHVSFTFNLGFFHDLLYKTAWDKTYIPKVIKEYDCFLNTRIGHLINGTDIWFQLNQDTIYEELRKDIRDILETSVQPLFLKYQTIESFDSIFNNEPTNNPLQYVGRIYDRIVYFFEMNNPAKGAHLLHELLEIVNKNGNSTKTIYRLAHHYNIQL
jgi:hypothetical protein